MRTDRNGQTLLIAGGLLAFTMIGWTSLLMPSLIRDIQRDLAINDGEMGLAYGVFTLLFLGGCLFAGWAASRIGRRPLLVGALVVLMAGVVLPVVPSWPVFLAAAALRGFGSGIVEVGIQALFLATFTGAVVGRAINGVHFMYSVGAVLSPLAMAALLGVGLTWTSAMALSAVPMGVAVALLAVAPMAGRTLPVPGASARIAFTGALVGAAVSIALYVAVEVGVSSWLVRFLDDVDLGVAAAALTLFWVALAASRLVAARFGHRVAPARVATLGFVGAAVALAGAVIAPSAPLSIALFTAAGFAAGPIYAAIILLAGRAAPHHQDAATSIVASAGVAGSVIYPPVMGAISLGAGLEVAMFGAALLGVAGAILVAATGRAIARQEATAATA